MGDLFYTLKLFFYQAFIYSYQHKFFLQAAASVNVERITDLHHFITFFLIIILVLVIWLLLVLIDSFIYFNKINNKFDNVTKKYCDDVLIFLTMKLKQPSLNKTLVSTSQVLREVLIMFYYVYPNIMNLNKTLLSIKLINIEKCNLYIRSLFFYNIATTNIVNGKFVEQKVLEFNWTLVPCLVLILISVPSFHVLYINEEIINPALTVNIMGHQWFWSYDYTDLFPYWFNLIAESVDIDDFVIESYMEPEEFLRTDVTSFRLYETEEPLFLPVRVHLRLMISSFDVLHSFAMPSMGLKVDAVPGRINQLELFIKRTGVFFGQCSEICGVGHAFMPIEIHAVSYLNFLVSAVDPIRYFFF